MNSPWYKVAATFLFVVGLVATFAWLTQTEEDPCATQQVDISAAVLGGSPDDQEGLVNRAIIVRGECESAASDKENDKDQ
jgi:hypothetical protein